MTSLWRADRPPIDTHPFVADREFDHVVVGAGFTGLITALLLARAGRRVAVVEARTIGALASGNTTAKLSLLQGTRMQKVRDHSTRIDFEAWVGSQVAGFDWMLGYLAEAGIPFDWRDAVTYAETPDEVRAVEREHALAHSVGLGARLHTTADLPFRTHAAVVLPNQVQFDPMDVLESLAADVRALGGVIHEHVRVVGVRTSKPVRVRTDRGELRAASVVLATGTPILDRGLYFAKLEPKRSYLVSFDVADAVETGMFLGAGDQPHSIRWHEGKLLVGGGGHGVGRAPIGTDAYADLEAWTRERWPDAIPMHRWSAQDYTSPSHIPFVGALPRGRGRIFFASGYDKWGMTSSASSALTLLNDLTGAERPRWQKQLRRRMTVPTAIASGIGANAAVGAWYARSWAEALTKPGRRGVATVGRDGLLPTGTTPACSVALVCPHLGAALRWNDADATWDCPAHGSRFAPTGERLEGPAVRDLVVL